MDIAEIREWFVHNGWKEWPVSRQLDNCDYSFYKKFPGAPRCQCNSENDLSISAQIWLPFTPEDSIGIQLHLRAQPHGAEEWADLMVYSIDSVHRIPQLCEQLVRAWEAINN